MVKGCLEDYNKEVFLKREDAHVSKLLRHFLNVFLESIARTPDACIARNHVKIV
jgi:hypothetical protein